MVGLVFCSQLSYGKLFCIVLECNNCIENLMPRLINFES